MITTYDVVRAAIPGANDDLCEHVIWARTPFPMKCDARVIFKAASRLRRATAKGLTLCEFCDNVAPQGIYTCKKCESALALCRDSICRGMKA